MSKTKMFKFSIKNLKYALRSGDNTYDTVKDLAYANSISLEADFDETALYGDGQKLAVLADDKGKTGTLSVTNIEEGYEVDMGRAMRLSSGLADVQQIAAVRHALYFETDAIDNDGKAVTIKNWLLNCTSGKASESYQQTTDNPTINNYDYSLVVMGEMIKNAAGTADYVDANGNTRLAYRISCFPGDAGYDTFGATVPMAKVASV